MKTASEVKIEYDPENGKISRHFKLQREEKDLDAEEHRKIAPHRLRELPFGKEPRKTSREKSDPRTGAEGELEPPGKPLLGGKQQKDQRRKGQSVEIIVLCPEKFPQAEDGAHEKGADGRGGEVAEGAIAERRGRRREKSVSFEGAEQQIDRRKQNSDV